MTCTQWMDVKLWDIWHYWLEPLLKLFRRSKRKTSYIETQTSLREIADSWTWRPEFQDEWVWGIVFDPRAEKQDKESPGLVCMR